MNTQPAIVRTDPANPLVQAAAEAEQRLFAHYGLIVKEQYITLKDHQLRVRVLEAGAGPPVLIVPGGSGEAVPWVGLMALLKGWRCIAVDRPGGGLSDFVDHRDIDFRGLAVSTLVSVLDTLEIKSAPVLGNSMGGLWGFWLALDRPERVTKMVQFGCPALLLDTSAPPPMRLLSVPALGRAMLDVQVPKDVDTALNGLSSMGSRPEQIRAIPRETADAYYQFRHLPAFPDSWVSLQARVLTVDGAKPDLQLKEAELRRVQQPVLFVWGDQDPFGAPDVGRRAASMMPEARLVEVKAGHLPFLDEPAECARLAQEFLAATPEAA